MRTTERQSRPTSRKGVYQTLLRILTDRASLLPTLILVFFFFVIPLVLMVIFSFATQDTLTAEWSFGWNLRAWKALGHSVIFTTFVRSLALSFLATVLCAIIGYPLAYFIARHSGQFHNLAFLLVIVPFWVSFTIRTYAWIGILRDSGPINQFLLWTGLVDEPVRLVYNYWSIVIGIIYGYLPLMVFPIYVALDSISNDVLEAARDLGASPFSTFWKVTFPLALPGLVAGCILVWVPATGEYVIPEVLGGGKTYMFGNVIAQRFTTIFKWPEGAAFSVALIIFMLLLIGLAFTLIKPERLGEVIEL